jgi:hypothetical protein
MKTSIAALVLVFAVPWSAASALAGDRVEQGTQPAFAAHGYETLTTKPYVPPDFDQETFDNLWQSWEEPLRSQAEKATPEERRAMAFSRYGLTTTPGDNSGNRSSTWSTPPATGR